MTDVFLWIPHRMMDIEVASYYDYIIVLGINVVSEIFMEFADQAFIAWIIDMDN